MVEEGVTGVLTPPGDVEALVTALEPLMRDPASASAMGGGARARVLEKFSLDAEANRIAAVYRALVRPYIRDKHIEVAAGKQEARQACGVRGLDIGRAVADDKAAFAPHRPMLIRSWIMPGLGFRQ